MSKHKQSDSKIESKQKVYISKATVWAFFTYAPFISFIFNLLFLPGHVVLFPYYLIAMIFRKKAPNFLVKWVRFNSHGLFRVKTIEGECCKRFWCLYFIYGGFIINFVLWVIAISLLGLIFTIFVFIEEWRIFSNIIYRLTFGYFGKITNDPPVASPKNLPEDIPDKLAKGSTKVLDKEPKQKKKLVACPVCGVEVDDETSFCPKCGSILNS